MIPASIPRTPPVSAGPVNRSDRIVDTARGAKSVHRLPAAGYVPTVVDNNLATDRQPIVNTPRVSGASRASPTWPFSRRTPKAWRNCAVISPNCHGSSPSWRRGDRAPSSMPRRAARGVGSRARRRHEPPSCRPHARRRAVNRHLDYAFTRGAWPARALKSLPGDVSTGRTLQLLTSSDHAHAAVVLIRSASDRLEAPRADALVDCSERRICGSLWVSEFLHLHLARTVVCRVNTQLLTPIRADCKTGSRPRAPSPSCRSRGNARHHDAAASRVLLPILAVPGPSETHL